MNFFSLLKRKIIYKFKKKIKLDEDLIKNKTLDELFHHYGSDKADIFKISGDHGHGFSKFYSKKLNPIYLLQVLWNSNVLKEKP